MKDSPFNFLPRKYFLCRTVLSCLCFPPKTAFYPKHFNHIYVSSKNSFLSYFLPCVSVIRQLSTMHLYLQTAFCYTYFLNSCLQYVRFFKQLSTYICFFIQLSVIHPGARIFSYFLPFCPQEQRTCLQYIWFLFLLAQIFALHLFLFLCHTAFWHAAVSLFTSSSYQLCNYISMLAIQHFVIHLLCCISRSIFLFLLPHHTVFSNFFFTHFSNFDRFLTYIHSFLHSFGLLPRIF
jgi:hypothetical protein